MGITVLSLFDGISTGQLALKRAGIRVDTYYASEIDKNAIQIAMKNFPNTVQLGSVNEIDFSDPKFNKVELIIGGSPCTDLSIAKRNREGLMGNSSKLFYKFVEAVKTIKPKYFLLENVASMSEESKDIISDELGVQPININSSLVSAQLRNRLYWTNIPYDKEPEDKKIFMQDILQSGKAMRNKSWCITASYSAGTSFPRDHIRGHRPSVAEPYKEGDEKLPGRTAFVVKNKSTTVPMTNIKGETKNVTFKIDLPDGKYTSRKLTPVECERLQTLPDNYTEGIANTNRYKAIGNGWTTDVITHLFKNIKV